MSPSTTSLAPARAPALSLATSLIGSLVLGAVIVFATGLSPSAVAHNAAHDMRHANGFPCH